MGYYIYVYFIGIIALRIICFVSKMFYKHSNCIIFIYLFFNWVGLCTLPIGRSEYIVPSKTATVITRTKSFDHCTRSNGSSSDCIPCTCGQNLSVARWSYDISIWLCLGCENIVSWLIYVLNCQ